LVKNRLIQIDNLPSIIDETDIRVAHPDRYTFKENWMFIDPLYSIIFRIVHCIDPLYVKPVVTLFVLVSALTGKGQASRFEIIVSALGLHNFGPDAVVHKELYREFIARINLRGGGLVVKQETLESLFLFEQPLTV
jgi:hypothetical protein